MIRVSLMGAAVTLAVALGGAAGAFAQTAPLTLRGTITAGSGAYAHASGAVAVRLTPRTGRPAPGAPFGTRFSFTLGMRGTCPVRAGSCLALKGSAHGLGSAARSLPDVGSHARLTGIGVVRPPGAVTFSGTLTTPGFILHGHTQLKLRLRTGRGTITVEAQS